MICVWKSSKITNPWRFQLGKSDMGCFGGVQPESCSFKIRPSQVGYLHPAAKVYKTLHFPNRFGARHPLGFVCRLNSQENSENPPGATKTLRASDQEIGTPPDARIGSTLWPLVPGAHGASGWTARWRRTSAAPWIPSEGFRPSLASGPEKFVTSTRASYPHPPIWL